MKIIELVKQFPNDHDLGAAVRTEYNKISEWGNIVTCDENCHGCKYSKLPYSEMPCVTCELDGYQYE